MNKIRDFFSRFRLVYSLMALAVLLSAIALTPVHAQECVKGCWNWNASTGCTQCMICCVHDDGSFQGCVDSEDNDHDCGTGGPRQIN
jgi:hypothetical protein